MKIGVFGPNGRLGEELVRAGCSPLFCDITNEDDIKDDVNSVNCDIYIDCAAYTNVDACEDPEEYDKARQVNTWGLSSIVNATTKPVIYISTDYIFSGLEGPYSEDANQFDLLFKSPVNNYGWSKWGGEILADQLTNCYVVRTTGLWGNGNDFLEMVTTTLQKGERIKITSELWGNQTYIPHLVEGLIRYAELKDRPKILHIASRDIMPRYFFAVEIAKTFGYNETLISECTNDEVPGWVAKRPTLGGLWTNLAREIGIPIYTIAEGLNDYRQRTT